MENQTLRALAGLAPPNEIDARTTALLLIDFQMDYFFPDKVWIPDGEQTVTYASRLVHWADLNGIAVVHVQHVSHAPGAPVFAYGSKGAELHPVVQPLAHHRLIQKGMPSSFNGTELKEFLAGRGIKTLVVCGLMTHMCVSTTARDAVHLGLRVIVAGDACATRALPGFIGGEGMDHRTLHRAALIALSDRFADILPTLAIVKLPVKD